MLALLASGFLFWLVGSQNGTRLLLTTAAQQLNGQALDVNGSLLRGVSVGKLDLDLGGTRIDISDLHLDVHWRALGDRLLHVRDVSAGSVRVALTSSPDAAPKEDDGAPFTLPSLPVDIAVDRVALGDFQLDQDSQPLPVTLGDLNATFAASKPGAQLRCARRRVGHAVGQADVSGQAELQGMADPWPFAARLDVTARGSGLDSPLCQADKLSGVFDTRPVKDGAAAKPDPKAKVDPKAKPAPKAAADTTRAELAGPPAPACQVVLRADAAGSMDGIQAKLAGAGSGMLMDVVADLAPRTALVLRSARANAQLPDKSTLSAQFDLQSDTAQGAGRDRIVGTVSAQRLDLAPWLGEAIPPAVLTVRGDVQADIENLSQLRHAAVDLRFEDGTRWNKQPLTGALKAQVDLAAPDAATPGTAAPPADPALDPLAGLRIHGLDVDLKLGRNRVQAKGELDAKDGALTLDAQAPQLDAFWPGIPGGAELKGKFAGTVAAHRGEVTAGYTPAKPRPGVLGQAPAKASIVFTGAWGKGAAGQPDAALLGWRGAFSELTADTAGFTVTADRPVTLAYLPSAPDAARQGTPDPGASGLARRRQALGNRWPGRQSGHPGRHGPPGDRRRRPRGGFQAGQRA
ncbi:hypothetical protein G6F57_013229 [Rhizopus arrhizus]|nr:hypothetical protein G6F57_013229 [Rhizopus arrhizus]